MYDIQLCAWFRFSVHPCYHYIRKRKGSRPRFYSSVLAGSTISISASSGDPRSPCFPLHYNYTFGCTGFSVKSFHGVLDSILQRSVVSSNSSFTSASPGFLHFLYTIIIHIAALDFRRKVSKHQNWASTRLSYLEAKDEITGSLFHSLVAVTLKNILPAIGKDRAQRIIHPNVKVKAFQKEKQVMVSACRLQF